MPPSASQALVSLLLVAELLCLSIAFDTQRLDGVSSLSARIVNFSPQLLRLSVAVAAATIAVAIARGGTDLRALFAGTPGRSRLLPFVIHISSLAVFVVVTARIVESGSSFLSQQAIWTGAWLLAGLTTFVSWALVLQSAGTWLSALRNGRSSLALGLVGGSAAWATGFVTDDFWMPLRQSTFGVVTWMLGLFYQRTVSDPGSLMVGTPTFKVIISPPCSGYEGIGLMLTFLSGYLWLFRKEYRFPAVLFLLPLGAVLIWLANAVRIVTLIAIGTSGWRAVANGGFHSQAGWIAFIAIALGFVALIDRSRYFKKADRPASLGPVAHSTRGGEAVTAYLGPFLVVSATAMITGAFSAGFDWLYPLRIVAVGAVVWSCRSYYATLRWSYSWWSFSIGLVTFVLWLALLPDATDRNAGWPIALQSIPVGWAALWLLLRGVGYIVAAPLAEELAFRGFLLRRLVRRDFQNVPVGVFSWVSFVGSSLIFGAFHGSLWLPGTIAGMSFAVAVYRHGALGEAVWAHATTNGLIALYACATGRWSVWS